MALSILLPHPFYTFIIKKYAQYLLLWAPEELIKCSYDHMGRAPNILRISRKCFFLMVLCLTFVNESLGKIDNLVVNAPGYYTASCEISI